MIQDIATLLTVSGAFVYSAIAIYKQIRKAFSPEAGKCNGCNGCNM